jgi:hypothetical protein
MGFRRGYGIGYGRGFGFGRGYGLGYGRGYGWRYSYNADPSRCDRFPWLPRWWWSNPNYAGTYPVATTSGVAAPVTPYAPMPEERAYLECQMNYLEQELAAINKRLDEMKAQETV